MADDGETGENNENEENETPNEANLPQVLLVYDHAPWDSNANETVLNQLGLSYRKIGTADLPQVNLWDYKMLIIANDQASSSYDSVKQFRDAIDLFINLGGVVVFGAADGGWADGRFDWELPGGVVKHLDYDNYNYIDDTAWTHPIVTGELTDNVPLQNDYMVSNYCSHDYFDEDTLPLGAKVIFRSTKNDHPTLVEYPLGSGHVILNGLTWEFTYDRYGGYGTNYFSRIAFDDLLAYAWSLTTAVDEPDNVNKMQIGRDNNSFGHYKASFFNGYYNQNREYVLTENDNYAIDSDLFMQLYLLYLSGSLAYGNVSVNPLQLILERDSHWGGSCYGISTTMALIFENEINLSLFDNDAQDYYHMDAPKDNARVRSMINYYQLAQFVPQVSKQSVDAYRSDKAEYQRGLTTIVKMAQQSERSGVPFIFTMGYKWQEYNDNHQLKWKSAGHAIVCIGCQAVQDGYRLEFVDPNSVGSKVYAKVSADYSSIEFESIYTPQAQQGNGRSNWQLFRVGYNTLSALRAVDIDNTDNLLDLILKPWGYNDAYLQSARQDVITFNSDAAFTITTITDEGETETLTFDGAEIGGSMPIYELRYMELGDSLDIMVAVDAHSEYVVTCETDGLDISFYNDDVFHAFIGNGAETVTVEMSEGITAQAAQGEIMDYNLYTSVTDEGMEMVKLAGEGAEYAAIQQQDGGVTAKTDVMDNVELTGFSADKTFDITNCLQETEESNATLEMADTTINFNSVIGSDERAFVAFYSDEGKMLELLPMSEGSAVVANPDYLNWQRAVLFRLDNESFKPLGPSVIRWNSGNQG